MATPQGDTPTGDAVKNALESLRDFDTWGLTPAFTYTSDDHRPTTKAKLYIIQGGKLVLMREVSVDRDPRWLGK